MSKHAVLVKTPSTYTSVGGLKELEGYFNERESGNMGVFFYLVR